MFWLKRCPRCSGDLYGDHDQYGAFVSCLQCGMARDIVSNLGEPLRLVAAPQVAVTVAQEEGEKRRRISHGGRHFASTFDFNFNQDSQDSQDSQDLQDSRTQSAA